jgi:hypothetical protein
MPVSSHGRQSVPGVVSAPVGFRPGAHTTFERTDSLGIFYFVYGGEPDSSTGKPRVSARYFFCLGQKATARTEPKLLAVAGGPSVANDEIPLAAFEPGEYRLVVQVKDEIAVTTLERRSSFRVGP